jgi:hypothetical protein
MSHFGGGPGGGVGSGGGGGGGGGGTPKNRDADDDAEQKAAERNLIRRCVDYHNPAVVDLSNRLYRKACRSSHVRNYPYLQPHSAYIRNMGMPISEVSAPNPSQYFLTYMAHIARAKNSTPVHCLSWTPGGRRLLTGNYEGEFTLWDGHTFSFELIMSAHDTRYVLCTMVLCDEFAVRYSLLLYAGGAVLLGEICTQYALLKKMHLSQY